MRTGHKHIDGRELTTALVFLGVSLIVLWEAYRLAADPPPYRLDQPLKPGMYLAIIGALLLLSGLIYLTGLVRGAQDETRDARDDAGQDDIDQDDAGQDDSVTAAAKSGSVSKLVLLMGILTAYALLISMLGYTVATFLFFVAACRFFGVRHPVALICWPLLFTSTFALVFIYLLRVQIPSGPLDLLLL